MISLASRPPIRLPLGCVSLLFTAILCVAQCLGPHVALAQDPVLPEWAPEINPAISQLGRVLFDAQDPQLLIETQSNLLLLYDARLFMTFHRWIDMVTGDERVQQLGEQRRWLKQREEAVDSIGVPPEAGSRAIEMTLARTTVIEQRLADRHERWLNDRRRKK